MKKIIFAMILLVVLAYVTAKAVDGEWLISYIKENVSKTTGRELNVNGEWDIDWGLRPVLTINDITYDNAEWSEHAHMIEVSQLQLGLDIKQLFRGDVVLFKILIDQPKIYLQRNKEGSKNWEIDHADATAVDTIAPENRYEFPVIEYLSINDGVLHYIDLETNTKLAAKLASVEGNEQHVTNKVRLSADGIIQNSAVNIESEFGSFELLRDSSVPYPINIELSLGKTSLSLNGTIDKPLEFTGTDLTMKISGPNPADLQPLINIPLPTLPPYEVAGQLVRKSDIWKFNNFSGTIGDSDISGDFTVDIAQQPIYVLADIKSENLDFDDLAGLIGASPDNGDGETASKEQIKENQIIKADNRILPNKPIDFSQLSKLNADVKFIGKKVKTKNFPLNEMFLNLQLINGVMRVDPLKFVIENGSVDSRFDIDTSYESPNISLSADIKRLDLRDFIKKQNEELDGFGTIAGFMKINSTGSSISEVLSNGDGEFVLAMESGVLDSLIIELIGADIAESIAALFDEEESYNIRCMVSKMSLSKGTLISDVFVIDTTDTNIIGEGTLNFHDEALDFTLKPHPKDVSLFSARGPIHIKGTLNDLSVTLDAKTLGGKGLAAIALGTLLTPVAAIVPFIETGLGDNSNCNELTENAKNSRS